MKVIIKIKSSSIKRNPNAFNTQTIIQKGKRCEFTFEGNKIPEWINNEGVFVTSKNEEKNHGEGKEITLKGEINNPNLLKRLGELYEKDKSITGLVLNLHQDIEIIHHRPEPEYLCHYENPEVECSDCHLLIKVNDIEEDEMDENLVQICPKCGHINTFDFEYEKIEIALKGLRKV